MTRRALEQRAMVAASTEPVPPGQSAVGADGGHVSSVSRVVVKHGMALLDPRLVSPVGMTSRSAESSTRSSAANAGPGAGETEGATSSANPLSTAATPHDHSLVSYSGRKDDSMGAQTGRSAPIHGAQATLMTDEEGKDVVMMLIPASSVRWGTSWADSVPGAEAPHNSSYAASGRAGHGTGEEEAHADTFIELGCSVFKAQVVQNAKTHPGTSNSHSRFMGAGAV